MPDIRTTRVFDRWFGALKDRTAKRRIQARIDRLAVGHRGDWKPVGLPVIEMRVAHGPGYRVYFAERGDVLVVLLCGGDKSSQDADIRVAHRLARKLDWE